MVLTALKVKATLEPNPKIFPESNDTNPLYLPFLSIFLHDFLVICQFEFVCIPSGMTAEPKSHGRPTKPQRESG